MKKSLLSSAVAIAVASTAHATSYNVTTNITGVQVWMNHIDVKIDCPYPVLPDPIDIDGTAEGSSPTQIDSANLSIGGTVCLDLGAGLVARLVFALSNGQYSASAPGTTFTGCTISAWSGGQLSRVVTLSARCRPPMLGASSSAALQSYRPCPVRIASMP